MSNHEQTPDLLVLFTALLALVFSPALASVLAPYAAIILGAMLGAGWGLKRRPTNTKGSAWAFISLMLGSAFVFTMPAAVWLQQYIGAASYNWTLAPIALLIGAVGEDWPAVGYWVADLGRRLINRKTDVADNGQPPR